MFLSVETDLSTLKRQVPRGVEVMRLYDKVRMSRISAVSAARRMENILGELSVDAFEASDFDRLAHASAILTKQLKTLYLRTDEAERSPSGTVDDGTFDELDFFESQVRGMAKLFAEIVLKRAG